MAEQTAVNREVAGSNPVPRVCFCEHKAQLKVCEYLTMSSKKPLYKNLDEIENLVRAFEDCTLPRWKWTHRAHLTVALWYLTHYSDIEATNRICDGIQRYNSASGIQTTKDSGYHVTLTLFWIAILRQYIPSATGNNSILELANQLNYIYQNSYLPLEYYSRDLLMSYKARTTWV